MYKLKSIAVELLLLFIITIPAFMSLLNNQYFSMHDDQHIVRLFLLDQGLRQGNLFPRWVGGLGFGFGYPLFNFYPPLIYYIGEVFHILGFSLIWSIKLTFILGFYLGAVGVFLLVKNLTNRLSGFLAATLYTFFFYHSVLIYVRGALAEFYGLTLLPFLFLAFENLLHRTTKTNSIIFGICFALLILAHPLIAFPTIFFLGLFFIFYLFSTKFNLKFVYLFIFSLLLGITLSAFFWLPSFVERKYTMTDQILTGELASYKLHYILPQQFIYSPWGYGGSGQGLTDGMTFQLGKIHIGLVIGAIILSIIYFLFMSFRAKSGTGLHLTKLGSRRYLTKSRNPFQTGVKWIYPLASLGRNDISYFYFFLFLLILSLFMATEYSSFIWDNIQFLSYLQFPWRFLTFTSVFISVIGGYSVYFLAKLLKNIYIDISIYRYIIILLTPALIFLTIFVYGKYFKPGKLLTTTDHKRTSFEEISWRISSTSYEFVPKGVKTKKSALDTTILAIEKKDLPKNPYNIVKGQGEVTVTKNNFSDRSFLIQAMTPVKFRLNTFNFPGWNAYLNNNKIIINDNNDLKLITVNVPLGTYNLSFRFEDTHIRKIADYISLTGTFFVIYLLFFKFKKVNG